MSMPRIGNVLLLPRRLQFAEARREAPTHQKSYVDNWFRHSRTHQTAALIVAYTLYT